MSRLVGFFAALLMLLATDSSTAAPPDEPRVLSAEQFDDSVLYGRTKPGEARLYLISMLDRELREVQRIYSFTEAQVAAIRKEGERDIDRWFETVAQARAKYTKDPLTPEQYKQARTEITNLRMALQTDLFGPTSFYRGAINKAMLGNRRVPQARQEQEPLRAQIIVPGPAVRVVDRPNVRPFRPIASVTLGPNGEQMFAITNEQFAQMFFGGGSAEQVRQLLISELDRELQVLDRRYSLTEAQQKKLRLAGRGDINDWFDRLEELRATTTAEPLPRERFEAVLRDLQALNTLRGTLFFSEPSLLRRILTNTLTAEQSARGGANEPPRRTQVLPGF